MIMAKRTIELIDTVGAFGLTSLRSW